MGLLQIPEDLSDFKDLNGEHGVSMTLTHETSINVQFPIAIKSLKKLLMSDISTF